MAAARVRSSAAPKVPARVLIAPDKFKGTLSADQAARAIERGLKRAWPGVKTTRFALTDGGEGFMELMVRQTGGKFRTSWTTDAAGRRCRARWGVLGNGLTAVIGLSEASGIAQLPAKLRNPERTTNRGTGQLMKIAADAGFKEILVWLGGSATTEGGTSLAAEFGFTFLDKVYRKIDVAGENLSRIARIELPKTRTKTRFVVATDVDSPLFGRDGAAYQFAPQKGANPTMVRRLDAGLRTLARVVKRDVGKDLAHAPGAGAAGGCGYGLMVFFNARRESGFQVVRRLTGLDALIRGHDLVITGEGCFDRTSLQGKAPAQLGHLARKLRRPAWALCGRVALAASRAPFDRLAGLSTPRNPGPELETLTPARHAGRRDELA